MVPIEWERREYRVASAVSMAHDFGSSLSTLGGSGVGKERTTSGLEAFRVISFHSVLMLW